MANPTEATITTEGPTLATGMVADPTVATGAVMTTIPTVGRGLIANPSAATGAVQPLLETYWEPRATSCGEDLKLFLRLFEPASGTLSKRKPKQ